MADRILDLVRHISASSTQPADQDESIDELIDLLIRALPRGDPLLRAIADNAGTRGAVAQEESYAPTDPGSGDDAVLAMLRRLLAGARNAPEAVMRGAEARLLAAPAVSAAGLRARGGDPDQAHLINLAGPNGPQLPAFQFDPAGRPIPIVLDVNALLDADGDPWGVADWWLGRNAWLGQAPAESLGRITDDLLLGVARAAAEGD